MDPFQSPPIFLSLHKKNAAAPSHLDKLWKLKVPPKVIAFSWSTILGGILTMDNFKRRGMTVVSACPTCLAEAESVGHLLLNCRSAQLLWKSILGWFECGCPLPNSLPQLSRWECQLSRWEWDP
eukprot:TRINITY_DN8614_c0_g1_i6.p1 TRINITY_DN8614_c0_g1~~TRINITY_DN8614_c0_g1_i6.p1  ORF type:complete len:124 (-),score=7.29 TRINITY_DN8614_c0_g1_i6:21-392(-)